LNWFLYRVRESGLVSGLYVWISTFSNVIVEKAIFSPPYVFGSCVKNQMALVVWAYFSVFYSIGLHVYFCGNVMLVLLLWLGSIIWSHVLWYLQHCFLPKIALAIRSLVCFHMIFRIDLSIFMKNDIGILMAIALNQ
jgi:hypothetical protein